VYKSVERQRRHAAARAGDLASERYRNDVGGQVHAIHERVAQDHRKRVSRHSTHVFHQIIACKQKPVARGFLSDAVRSIAETELQAVTRVFHRHDVLGGRDDHVRHESEERDDPRDYGVCLLSIFDAHQNRRGQDHERHDEIQHAYTQHASVHEHFGERFPQHPRLVLRFSVRFRPLLRIREIHNCVEAQNHGLQMPWQSRQHAPGGVIYLFLTSQHNVLVARFTPGSADPGCCRRAAQSADTDAAFETTDSAVITHQSSTSPHATHASSSCWAATLCKSFRTRFRVTFQVGWRAETSRCMAAVVATAGFSYALRNALIKVVSFGMISSAGSGLAAGATKPRKCIIGVLSLKASNVICFSLWFFRPPEHLFSFRSSSQLLKASIAGAVGQRLAVLWGRTIIRTEVLVVITRAVCV
jgi:hypothetical protein